MDFDLILIYFYSSLAQINCVRHSKGIWHFYLLHRSDQPRILRNSFLTSCLDLIDNQLILFLQRLCETFTELARICLSKETNVDVRTETNQRKGKYKT